MKINTQSPASVNTTSLLGELFLFEGHAVRVVGTAENPLFVAADIGDSIGFIGNKGSDNLRSLEGDEVAIAEVQTGGGPQRMLCVTESGLYALVFKSRKPEAIRFRRWVTGEVLPAVRKHGFYHREGMDARLARIERAKLLRARKQALLTEARALSTEISRLEDLGADAATPGAVLAEAGLEHSGAALIRAVRNCLGFAHRNHVPVGRDRTGHMTLPTAAIRTALGLDQTNLNLS